MKFIRAFLAVCGLVAAETPTIAPGAVRDLLNEGGHEHDEQ
jgi:hypothetical protein